MKSTKKYYRVYEVKVAGLTFEIDGQNHEGESNEWELFETSGDKSEWWDTFPTKRDALEWLTERFAS